MIPEDKNIVPVAELQAEQLELRVSEKTIGSLTTNAKEIRDLVQAALPKYDISNYSTENIAKAKADKALLNKAAKTLNDKRVEFEREFMSPFGEFKEVVAETVKLIKDAVGKIDTVIKADEERTKNEKRTQIEQTASNCGWDEIGVPLEKIWCDKWLNKTTSLKAVEVDIRSRMATINADIKTFSSFAEDFNVLVVRYKENLNFNETVAYANQLKAQREATKAAQEAKEEAPANAAPSQKSAAPAVTPVEPQTEQEPQPAPPASSHGIDDADRDVADAFAAAMGQAVETPKPSATYPRYYEIYAKDEQFKALEDYMTKLGLTFTQQD